jgi:hypothetical protein
MKSAYAVISITSKIQIYEIFHFSIIILCYEIKPKLLLNTFFFKLVNFYGLRIFHSENRRKKINQKCILRFFYQL